MGLAPRIVMVTRPTPYEELVARHATRNQAEFFLRQRGQNLDEVEARHHEHKAALARVQAAIPTDWRRNLVLRAELDRFLFEPEDVIVVVGQDGLVANVAKYLKGQAVIGVNPTPELFDGILVPHRVDAACERIVLAGHGDFEAEERTLVEAVMDDGQKLTALNEVFLGQRTHQSARYELTHEGQTVTHSSSGVIVTTGTGGTGWAHSIHLERHSNLALPAPTDRSLAFFVREAFPSIATSVECTEGAVDEEHRLVVTSRMEEGVIFGDGIENDFLIFDWGRRVELGVAPERLHLVQ